MHSVNEKGIIHRKNCKCDGVGAFTFCKSTANFVVIVIIVLAIKTCHKNCKKTYKQYLSLNFENNSAEIVAFNNIVSKYKSNKCKKNLPV